MKRLFGGILLLAFGAASANALDLNLDYVTLSASPSSVNFYTQKIGTSRTEYVYIHNQGTEPAQNIYASAFCDSSLYVTNGCYGNLGSYQSCSITVQFQPMTAGSHSCTINVSASGANTSVFVQGTAQE